MKFNITYFFLIVDDYLGIRYNVNINKEIIFKNEKY